MSSSDRGRDEPPGAPRETAPSPTGPGGADAYANWLDRMQRARARQAAITRNLYTWSNYKKLGRAGARLLGRQRQSRPEQRQQAEEVSLRRSA